MYQLLRLSKEVNDMAGVKGKSGRYKKYPNETPEEEKERLKARNRIYQREYYRRKKLEREQMVIEIGQREYKHEIEGENE
jgi:hypothetical protein